ncbi:hypothetical protein [Engelhardtia mirabilis]|uniref:SMP-30/Gluconolaconase/LRE-like region n=1 Tax=Engelhardtia mirabilis TaxID=2528011 RepID=A0A518BFI2_9BACT|nr:hypothetical protein Pla133_08040 [Planctomycetes bacterium Pla133]QDV00064.1 hypothetical protein Pla86_08030 [Planctomycetes bacterium Pla86]
MSPIRPCLLALAAPLAAAPSALADFVTLAWIDSDNFNVQVTEIPDLDQVRMSGGGSFGLPGNGTTYCVPTSAMNIMAYAATHGFPSLKPGNADWQLQSQYLPAGLALLQMGQFMNTNTTGGTGPSDAFEGVKSWLYGHPEFVASSYVAGNNYAPALEDMAGVMLGGGLVMACYGRYTVEGYFGSIPIIQRDGGHCTTLSRAVSAGNAKLAWVRDPASGGSDAFSQSTFANRTLALEEKAVMTGNSITQLKVMTAVDYDAEKTKNAYFDSYISLRPKAGLSFVNTPNGPLLKLALAGLLQGYGGPDTKTFGWDLASTVLDAVMGPDGNHVYVLSETPGAGPASVSSLELASSKVTPLLEVPGAQRLFFGRDRSLYAAQDGLLQRIQMDDEPPTVTSKPIPYPVDGLVFDDKVDEVVMLAVGPRRIVRYPFHLDGLPAVTSLPASIPSTIEPELALSPSDGRLWMIESASSKLFAFDAATGAVETVEVAGVSGATAVDVDDQGNLFVTHKNGLAVLRPAESGYEAWPLSPWSTEPGAPRFRIDRSRTNIDPLVHSGPAWRNLTPDSLVGLVDGETIEDCAGAAEVEAYGSGKAGASGPAPILAAKEVPVQGTELGVTLSGATPGSLAFLLVGATPLALPFDEGTMLVLPDLILPFPELVPATGTQSLSAPLSGTPETCGASFYFQAMYRDPGAPGYLESAQTNGLRLTIGS